ncbi:MAG: hypothetical protein H7Z11_08295 [Verrucomicrobia bacterium]|nr:hypothetical protein [Leptolyngbya sp. ES-bin-22]
MSDALPLNLSLCLRYDDRFLASFRLLGCYFTALGGVGRRSWLTAQDRRSAAFSGLRVEN